MSKSTVYRKDNYWEAVIQLRPFRDEVFDYIEKQMMKTPHEVDVTKIVELKTGIDIFITSQRFARQLGPKLKKRFYRGEVKITRKLHTRDKQRSKNVYRATVLFRYPFEENEVSSES
jgi:NMD protein affecting ribosome stability and mRNA decay